VCTCTHWLPRFAYQYGYGDENNSLPILLLDEAAHADAFRSALREQSSGDRRAIQARIIGRLSYGPYAFPEAESFAPAQRRLTTESAPGEEPEEDDPSDGLLVKVRQIEPLETSIQEPGYFTAYIWFMFWISRASEEGDEAPLRRNGEPLPDPEAFGGDREPIRSKRLYDELLPVFVHANVIDPVALRFQKGMLVELTLHVLRQAWQDSSRPRPDGAGDEGPIQFNLVAASDHPGCGCAPAVPPPAGQSLVELLRARLAGEADAAFARRVRLPDAASGPPEAFRALLSACHLPEMIADYYHDLREALQDVKNGT
jgi:hypothetical protein